MAAMSNTLEQPLLAVDRERRRASQTGCLAFQWGSDDREKLPDHYIVVDRRKPGVAQNWRILASCFILPWRLTAFLLGLFLCMVCYGVAKLEHFTLKHPLGESFFCVLGWRLLLCFNCILVSVEYVDDSEKFENLRDAPLIVANHTSWLDGPVLTTVLYRPRVLLISWVLKIPIIRDCVREMRCIPIDVSDDASRAAAFQKIQDHVDQWKKPPRTRSRARTEGVAPALTRPQRLDDLEQGGQYPMARREILCGEYSTPSPLRGLEDRYSSPSILSASEEDSDRWCVPRISKRYHGSQALLLFPEGNCCNGERIAPFKRGAFAPGACVRPVVCYWKTFNDWNLAFPYSRRFGCPGSVTDNFPLETERDLFSAEKIMEQLGSDDYDAGKATYETPTSLLREYPPLPWFHEFLCQPFLRLTVRVMPPYKPSAAEKSDPEQYARNVHNAMQTEFQNLRLRFKDAGPA